MLINTPKVSICCITYNHEETITNTIESFLAQEVDFPFEIIIGEDCSTDGTLKLINDYALRYPSVIRIISGPRNVGSRANFMRVVNSARGKYIAVCEGDDYWISTEKLKTQFEAMENNDQIILCCHNYFKLRNNELVKCEPLRNVFINVEEVIYGGGGIISSHSMFFRSELLKNLPSFFTTAPAGDYALFLVAAEMGKIHYINREYGVYRDGQSDSAMGKVRSLPFEAFLNRQIGIIEMLMCFDCWSDYKYNHHIKKKISTLMYKVSRKYWSRSLNDKVTSYFVMRPYLSRLDLVKVLFLLFFPTSIIKFLLACKRWKVSF